MIQYPSLEELRPKLQNAFDFAQKQVRMTIKQHPETFPMYTVDGQWGREKEAWTNWCEGFLGGMMWIFHRRSGDDYWREQAELYSRLIEDRKHDRNVHDLGFLFWSTWKRWYDQYPDQSLKATVITAGQTMGMRFKGNGQYLRSFVSEDSLFIDIMMNVGIIFYAALETDDEELLHKANQHCLTTRRYLVRGDGSTAHEGLFNTDTGEFLRQSTHQGWRDDSAWARGQAWALYGFGTAYEFSQDRRLLETAVQCADFYLEQTDLSEGATFGPGVPPNDWDEPAATAMAESSAAAIAASGMINLSKLVQDRKDAERYRSAALLILDTLTSPDYLADGDPQWEGILKHGIYHQDRGLGVDESVMWGEYFFVEALDKAMALEE